MTNTILSLVNEFVYLLRLCCTHRSSVVAPPEMEKSGGKFVLEWETHSKQISKGLCMLMERQCLVDIAVCCGSNTLHAHKCVLAASSSYFKVTYS